MRANAKKTSMCSVSPIAILRLDKRLAALGEALKIDNEMIEALPMMSVSLTPPNTSDFHNPRNVL